MTEQTATEYECRFESVIALPRPKAFKLVVDHPELWWTSPFKKTRGERLDVSIDPFIGGACYQLDGNGQQQVWGTVLSIEEPLYLRIAWQVSQAGEQIADPAAASRVMINFREASEVTRLEVVHSKFLRHGESGGDYMREMMQPDGWPRILKNMSDAAKAMR
ncbi:SRPBCC family protein [Roseibium sp.]|uniref:SRPBCC family protein n=1 Tax=Roseibium sp. TaxID=1936156 RepID=UPI003B51794B